VTGALAFIFIAFLPVVAFKKEISNKYLKTIENLSYIIPVQIGKW